MQVRLALVQLDAVSREVDRRLEEVAPGERAEGAVRVLQAERGAGDRAGGSADVEDLGRAAAEVHVHAVHVREVAVVEAEPGDGDEEVVDPVERSRARWTSMNPPEPGPVSGLSATQETSAAPTAASTAFPPAASTSAPACAVSG